MARRTWFRLRPPSSPPDEPPESSPPQAAATRVVASSSAGSRNLFIVRPFLHGYPHVHVTTSSRVLGPPYRDLALEQLGEAHHRDAEEDEDEQHRVGPGAVERLARQRDDVADPGRGGEQLADEQADQAPRDAHPDARRDERHRRRHDHGPEQP